VGVGRGRGRGGEEKYSLIRDAAGRTCGDSKVTKDNRKQQKVSIIMMAIFWLLFSAGVAGVKRCVYAIK